MLKRILMICLLVGVTWAQKAKEGEEPPFPLEKAQWVDNFSKAPRPVFDTNSIYTGDQANLTRKIAVGKHFMGASDDTIRIISPQSGGKRMLVIATDTTSTEFGTSKFRIDTTYSFPSGATEMAVAVGDVDGDAYTDILTGDNAAVSGYVWLRWFEWDADLANWVFRDSIGVGSGFKISANCSSNFTKYNSSVKREEFKEMTSQSHARTQFASLHCFFISCHTFHLR